MDNIFGPEVVKSGMCDSTTPRYNTLRCGTGAGGEGRGRSVAILSLARSQKNVFFIPVDAVLYCTVPNRNCTALYCTALYCIVLYLLYCVVWCCVV